MMISTLNQFEMDINARDRHSRQWYIIAGVKRPIEIYDQLYKTFKCISICMYHAYTYVPVDNIDI